MPSGGSTARRSASTRCGRSGVTSAVRSGPVCCSQSRAHPSISARHRLVSGGSVSAAPSTSRRCSPNLDDVMLTLVEGFGGGHHQAPARQMSDGTLRFLVILVALMQAPALDRVPESSMAGDAAGQTTLVIEELEERAPRVLRPPRS